MNVDDRWREFRDDASEVVPGGAGIRYPYSRRYLVPRADDCIITDGPQMWFPALSVQQSVLIRYDRLFASDTLITVVDDENSDHIANPYRAE